MWSRWTDGTGTTTVKNRRGQVVSITRDGQPVEQNKYGEVMSPFVRRALAHELPATDLTGHKGVTL